MDHTSVRAGFLMSAAVPAHTDTDPALIQEATL